jgi:1,3-beta-glucan synthase
LPGSVKDESQPSESGEAVLVKPRRTGGLKQKSFFTRDEYDFEEETQPREFMTQELTQSLKDKEIPPSCTIKIPDINTHEYEDIVHAVVWHVGRIFGFQAFNINPQTRKQV